MRDGEEIVITDRGRPVALLPSVEPDVDRLQTLITYVDTSALVKLLVADEAGTTTVEQLWLASTRAPVDREVASVRNERPCV